VRLREMSQVERKNRCCQIVQAVLLATILLLALHAGAAYAQSDLEIDLELDRTAIEVGEQAKLTVTVSGPSGFSEPVMPPTDGLDIILQGRTQSVQIINMKVKSSKIFIYALVPYRVGEFTIGPVQITRSGQTYESPTVDLSVEESLHTQTAPETAENVIVEAVVDNVNPYVGQQIILVFRFARRASARIRNVGYQLPDLSEFWQEEMKSKREYSKNIDGHEYLVTEVAMPLFPVKEGDLTIGDITFHYDEELPSPHHRDSPFSRNPLAPDFFDDDFFRLFNAARAERRIRHTVPIDITVRSLPQKEMPKAFKGGVGNFALSAALSNEEIKVGESTTLTISVSGAGNIRDIPDPEINIEGVKVYSDTPALEVEGDGDNVVGKKVYKLALVPQEAGPVRIPRISIPYFNPKAERYERAASAPLTLSVLPSEEESLVVTKTPLMRENKERVTAVKRDILPIHERLDSIEVAGFELWLRRLRLIAYPLPLLIYAACFVFIRHKKRLQTDTAYRRERMAGKMAQAHIEDAADALRRRQWGAVFTNCSRAVTEYLADKFNVPAGSLTPTDVESTLSSRGISKDFVTEIVGFLEGCDYGRFASSEENSGSAMRYIERAKYIIKRLEQEGAMKR